MRLEQLEARRLLAIFTVDNLNDAGAGSLRDAITMANSMAGPDIVHFESALSGETVLLQSELPCAAAAVIWR